MERNNAGKSTEPQPRVRVRGAPRTLRALLCAGAARGGWELSTVLIHGPLEEEEEQEEGGRQISQGHLWNLS